MTERKKREPRRARTEPVPGSDPTPQKMPRDVERTRAAEDTDRAWGDLGRGSAPSTGEASAGENDERLRRDVPPHW